MKVLRMAEQDLAGKRVLIRADMNVPQDDNGAITDDTRIRASIAGIRAALDKGAAVMVTSHLGRPTEGQFSEADSLAPVARRLAELLDPQQLDERGLETREDVEGLLLVDVVEDEGEDGRTVPRARDQGPSAIEQLGPSPHSVYMTVPLASTAETSSASARPPEVSGWRAIARTWKVEPSGPVTVGGPEYVTVASWRPLGSRYGPVTWSAIWAARRWALPSGCHSDHGGAGAGLPCPTSTTVAPQLRMLKRWALKKFDIVDMPG